jgi:hypothetical protein
MLDTMYGSIKTYFEEEIGIEWKQFEPYTDSMTEEEKEAQDWNVFFMSLREQSLRFFLIDRPGFLGSHKLSAFIKERLL